MSRKAEKILQTEEQSGIAETNTKYAQRSENTERAFVAVDIGTTTVVMQLVDADSEKVLHTVKFMNPQRSFGFDVLSRIQAAKFICRALNIEKYAQLDSIFNCPFKDVSADKGYVTMLWGLKIVNGTAPNVFSPDQSLTRAQSAILIYNAMEKG